jgi:hypothetical protein
LKQHKINQGAVLTAIYGLEQTAQGHERRAEHEQNLKPFLKYVK